MCSSAYRILLSIGYIMLVPRKCHGNAKHERETTISGHLVYHLQYGNVAARSCDCYVTTI